MSLGKFSSKIETQFRKMLTSGLLRDSHTHIYKHSCRTCAYVSVHIHIHSVRVRAHTQEHIHTYIQINKNDLHVNVNREIGKETLMCLRDKK